MIRQLTTLSLLALVASCTTQKAEPPKPAFDSSRNPDLLAPDLYPGGAAAEKEPVVRYGRYTLVSTQPDSGQRDLMAQIIDVSIPSNMQPNVRDAMQYVVNRSGYSLCSADAGHVDILYTRPLPAAQYKLGPMTLRNTLQVLAGPAWRVKVDEVNRQVCFVLRPGYQLPDPPRPATTLYAKQNATPSTEPASSRSMPSTPASGNGTSGDSSSNSGVTVSTVATPPAISPAPTATPPQASSSPTQHPVLSPVAPAKDGTMATVTTSPAPGQAKGPGGVDAASKPSTASTPVAVAGLSTKTAATPVPTPRPLPQIWMAASGSTLRDSVEDWAKRANWTVIWRADGLDYPIEAPLRFEGSFPDAISQVFPLYDKAPRPFYVDISPPSQRLIEVVEKK